jgi:hypothetical protein
LLRAFVSLVIVACMILCASCCASSCALPSSCCVLIKCLRALRHLDACANVVILFFGDELVV